ncbi:MAG: hypothetical protein U0625_13530 [Phycisphaerales bacterium]
MRNRDAHRSLRALRAARAARTARAAAAASLAIAALLAGCGDDDGDLWGDSMAPTQALKAEGGNGPAPAEMATSEGDSDDPFIDNANYPFVDEPWWQSPAYNGG